MNNSEIRSLSIKDLEK